jgi:hypothetical protein
MGPFYMPHGSIFSTTWSIFTLRMQDILLPLTTEKGWSFRLGIEQLLKHCEKKTYSQNESD